MFIAIANAIGVNKTSSGPSFDSDYQAILDYATTQGYTLPSDLQKAKENQLMIDLKASNIWSKLDTFANFATDGDSNFALIDWKRLIQYTPVNSPIFTANQGFTGGGTRYINTNYNPAVDGVNYKLNDAMAGVYIRTAPISPVGIKAVYGTTETDGLELTPQRTTTTANVRVNSSGAIAVPSTGQLGTWIQIRRTNDRIFNYKNGVEYSLGRLSTAISNNNIHLLTKNLGAVGTYAWDGQISLFFAGANLSDVDAKTMTGILENALIGGENKMSVFFGDSVTFGVGATAEANRWTSVFSNLQGTIEQNYGRSGSMMNINPDGLGWSMFERQNLIPKFIKSAHKYLFFAYGTNDCRTPLLYTAEEFEATYNIVLQTAYSKGWTKDRIKIVNIYNPTQEQISFNNALNSLCTDNNLQLLNVSSVIASNPSLYLSDEIHPSDAGYLAMANYINTNIL